MVQVGYQKGASVARADLVFNVTSTDGTASKLYYIYIEIVIIFEPKYRRRL